MTHKRYNFELLLDSFILDSVTNTKVYLSISYKTVNIQVKRLKIISKYINQGHSMHYHSKTGFRRQKFFQFLYTTVSVSKAEELLFRLFFSSPLKAIKEIIKIISQSLKIAMYPQSSKQTWEKIKMAIRHALCSTSYPTYRSGREI